MLLGPPAQGDPGCPLRFSESSPARQVSTPYRIFTERYYLAPDLGQVRLLTEVLRLQVVFWTTLWTRVFFFFNRFVDQAWTPYPPLRMPKKGVGREGGREEGG